MPYTHRQQRTISSAVSVTGIGFITGADVTLTFHPAAEQTGIQFQRLDLPGSAPVKAIIENTIPRDRRTAICTDGVTIELTEHVLAALYALQIDNCLITLDAPEPPGCDGSSQDFVDALRSVNAVKQSARRDVFLIQEPCQVETTGGDSKVSVRPANDHTLTIQYKLDYGPESPFPPQQLTYQLSPESFIKELAFARTFILEAEITALQALGYGKRTTAKDLIVFGDNGVIDNQLKTHDECVRHKVLDCVGDFALIGCDLVGEFTAIKSGHQLNREVIREVLRVHQDNSSTRAA